MLLEDVDLTDVVGYFFVFLLLTESHSSSSSSINIGLWSSIVILNSPNVLYKYGKFVNKQLSVVPEIINGYVRDSSTNSNFAVKDNGFLF